MHYQNLVEQCRGVTVIGQLLNRRYRITKVLATGGFGQTYLAEDIRRSGNPKCVVKQLQVIGKKPLTVEVGPRLFRKEVEVLGKLGKHSQIPGLLAHFEENKEFYLVEEFIPGHLLTKEIVTGEPLPEEQVIELLVGILEILVFVHKHGVIHRDIKPGNIIRRETDGKLVLIDFGAVKDIGTQITQGAITKTVAIGTRSYMPIEQFRGYPQFNSDIYALGMMGIQALTGLSAEELLNLQDPQTGEIIWRNRIQVSPKLASIIDRMVCFDCNQRYKSSRQALFDIHCLITRHQVAAVALDMRPECVNTGIADPSQSSTLPVSSSSPYQSYQTPQSHLLNRLMWVGGIVLVTISSGLSVVLWNQLPHFQSIHRGKLFPIEHRD